MGDHGATFRILGENAREAGLWECRAVEHSAVPSESHPFDPAVLKAIREFDPAFVPLWTRKLYVAPTGEDLIMGYHTIARWVPEPVGHIGSEPVRLAAVPDDWPFDATGCVYEVRTWALPWPKGSPQRQLAWADLFLPCDWDVFYYCRDAWNLLHHAPLDPQFFSEMARQEERRDQQRMRETVNTARQKLRDDRHMIKRAIEQENYAAGARGPQPYVKAEKVFTGETQ